MMADITTQGKFVGLQNNCGSSQQMQKEEQHMSSLVGVTFHEKRIFLLSTFLECNCLGSAAEC